MAHKKRKSKKHSTRSKPHNRPRGVFESNRRGFGFVSTSEGEFFIPASNVRDAMDGDLVEIEPIRISDSRKKGQNLRFGKGPKASGKRDEARIARVIERKHTEIVGRYNLAEPFGIVVPDDPRITHDIFTLREKSPNVPDGAMVRVRIIEYPTRRSAATGQVIQVLDESSGSFSIDRIVSRYGFETAFSEEAVLQAEACKLDAERAIESGYKDIRDRVAFTIDPSDAKDFDDALSIDEVAPGEFRLGVHIADVSAYVGWGSAIDQDAKRRATSVYLADRVIPMLPERLSNDLCSLRPGEDRLCMTCDIYVDAHANLLDYDLYPAVMRSHARLSYDQAQSFIDDFAAAAGAPYFAGAHCEIADDDLRVKLRTLSHLAHERQRNRETDGGIEFRTKEAKAVLDDEGRAIGIAVREKTDATGLVEEAMIYANEIVATYLSINEKPCAYRVHESPAVDAMSSLVPIFQEFKWFTGQMSLDLPFGNPHVIQLILDEAKGRSEDEMVTMLLLRSMMRAVYSPENVGHYGLGLRAYCHFTSPIRRYPDLMVHRLLKSALGFSQPDFKSQVRALAHLCRHSSEAERDAESASFDSQKQKMAEYMEQFIGREYDAVISGVVTYGLYVRLENCVEGLIPVGTLGEEYFAFSEAKHTLRGTDTNTTFRLGQRLRVKLVSVDTDLARIDFKLVE